MVTGFDACEVRRALASQGGRHCARKHVARPDCNLAP